MEGQRAYDITTAGTVCPPHQLGLPPLSSRLTPERSATKVGLLVSRRPRISSSGLEAPGMKCPRCQQENPPQANFCLECAAPLALGCANCGTQLPTGAKFLFRV